MNSSKEAKNGQSPRKTSTNGSKGSGNSSPQKIQPMTEQCSLKKNHLKHKCAFDFGPINLISLAQSICVIARLLEGVLGEINTLKEVMQGQEEEDDETLDSEEEAIQSVKERIPFFSYEELLDFDKQVASDQELSTLLQTYLKKNATATNPSICSKSIAKLLISKSLAKNMTWKGVGGKHGFEGLKLSSVVTKVVKKIFRKLKNPEKVVELAVGRWFTQTSTNIKKGRDKSDSPRKSNTTQPIQSVSADATVMEVSEASDNETESPLA